MPIKVLISCRRYIPGVQPYERKVTVYVPRDLDLGTPAPFITVLDGPGYVATMAPTLDTLIAEKRVPAMVLAPHNSNINRQDFENQSERKSHWF